MKRNSVLSEYKNGNKWVRRGVWLFALGFVLFIAFAGGMIHLWFTDFPRVGVPIPRWMTFCMLAGVVYLVIGACCIAVGMEPPSGGGGGRKNKKSKLSMLIGVQPV